jgi:hypothetical protein
MNRMYTFLAIILTVFVFDLFYFEAPPSASQDTNGSVAADAAANIINGVDSAFWFGFKPALDSQNNGQTSSKAPGQVFDPVTMLLLGSGLIGLAGLGRKKI